MDCPFSRIGCQRSNRKSLVCRKQCHHSHLQCKRQIRFNQWLCKFLHNKGKIEKFHQVVDDFIRESKLKNIRTLEELNRFRAVYMEEYYHKQKHAGIVEYYESLGAAAQEEGISPLQEWNRDSRPLTFLDAAVVSEAFLHHEQRKVDWGVQRKKVVCILDEAHLLEKETLEEFHLLLNYRFDSMSPMAVVLVGQTELWENKLKLQRYAAVRQRIDMYCTLPHLDRSETE